MTRAQLEVRRSVGLAMVIAIACAALAGLFGWRAVQGETLPAALLAAGFGLLALVWTVCLVDARLPLLVIDRQGLRLRFANQWVGLPWGQLDGVEHRRGWLGLRDGRLVPLGVNPGVLTLLSRRAKLHARLMRVLYGSPYAVPLGLATRTVGAGDDLSAALARLTAAAGAPEATLSEAAAEPEPVSEAASAGHEAAAQAGENYSTAAITATPASDAWVSPDPLRDPLTGPWQPLVEEVEDDRLPGPAEIEATDEVIADAAADEDAVEVPAVDEPVPGKRRADVPPDSTYPHGNSPSTWIALQSGTTDWNRGTDGGDRYEPTSALASAPPRRLSVVSPLLRDPRPAVAAGLAKLADLGRGAQPVWPTSGANALVVEYEETVEVVRLSEELPAVADIEATREVEGLAKQLAAGAETEVLPAAATRPTPELGPRLRSARNARGLTRKQVADRSGIARAVVQALESDDFEPSGGDFYVRGQLRTLGRVLGFDAEPLVADYDRWFAGQEIDANRVHDIAAASQAGAGPVPGRLPRGLILGALCLCLVLAAVRVLG